MQVTPSGSLLKAVTGTWTPRPRPPVTGHLARTSPAHMVCHRDLPRLPRAFPRPSTGFQAFSAAVHGRSRTFPAFFAAASKCLPGPTFQGLPMASQDILQGGVRDRSRASEDFHGPPKALQEHPRVSQDLPRAPKDAQRAPATPLPKRASAPRCPRGSLSVQDRPKVFNGHPNASAGFQGFPRTSTPHSERRSVSRCPVLRSGIPTRAWPL